MVSEKHADGPWVILEDDELEGCLFIPIETDRPVGPDLMTVCEVHGSALDLSITDTDRANARLIAAAPELLDALYQWKCPSCGGSKVYQQKARTEDGWVEKGVDCKVCSRTGLHPIAAAAIARATGAA